MAAGSPANQSKTGQISTYLLLLFILGWITEEFSLFDIGRYSVPLLYIAALPFCARLSLASASFLALPLVSMILSAILGALDGVEKTHILSQAALQLLAIVFAGGVASLDWPRNIIKLVKVMLAAAIPVVAYGGYQMVARAAHMRFAYLPVTNQQEYASGGLQRGWEKSEFTRASSFFVEPAAFGYFCLWLLALGLSIERGALRYWSLALAFGGILFSQSLSAVLGAGILLLVYFVTHPVGLSVLRQLAIVLLVVGLAIAIVPPLMPEAFARFSARIEQAVSLDERADSGRVDHLPAAWKIFAEAPIWGHGFSSLSASDDIASDVTSVTYALLLMERGVVGTILFLIPWIYIPVKSWRMPRADSAKTLALLLSALQLYIFWTSSVAYSLPFWLSLGITASLALHTHLAPQRSARM